MGERQVRVGGAAPPIRSFMEPWIKQTNMDFVRLLVQAEDRLPLRQNGYVFRPL